MQRRAFLGVGLYALARGVPATAQGLESAPSSAGSATIASCAIHPALGIARVGNAPGDGFLGPEVSGPVRPPEGGYRDAEGRLRRQGVRFRVYGLDANGQVVRELTARDAHIRWMCELANTKAAWYDFLLPLDLPDARNLDKAIHRRNPSRHGAERAGLEIRPGPRSIEGPSRRATFDGGRFLGHDVPLGEIVTDDAGRLIVFGGFGTSRGATPDTPLRDAINNDGWHDDSSDGPVTAEVTVDGRVLPCAPAWVACGPPAFAPGLASVVTLYDRMLETSAGTAMRTRRPSFSREVFPLLERLARHQWVNAGFARDFGRGSQHDFSDPEYLAVLADPSRARSAMRREVFRRFRRPNAPQADAALWPPYYGDHDRGPREFMAVLPSQHRALAAWARGDFLADWPGGLPRFASRLDELPVSEQPSALDRAQLDAASGGPFHPGIECGWVVRVRSLYAGPMRLRHRATPEPDFGSQLEPSRLRARSGPLQGLVPGGLTRWLGIPWQTDTSNCLSAYEGVDPYLPAFWPAFAPNDVFVEADYQALLAATTDEARARALDPARRLRWIRGWDRSEAEANEAFLASWHRHGLVLPREGPEGGPDPVWVETSRTVNERTTP